MRIGKSSIAKRRLSCRSNTFVSAAIALAIVLLTVYVLKRMLSTPSLCGRPALSTVPHFREYGASHLAEYLDACAAADIVPEVVWTFWFGDKMSETRRRNLASMETTLRVPVILLTDQNITQLLRWPLHPAFQYLSDNHKSDYLRIYFMYHYGGGYTDVKQMVEPWDVFFNKFDDPNVWIIGVPEMEGGVAVRPGVSFPPDHHKSMVSNGFMIARRGNRLLQEVYETQQQIMEHHARALEEHPAPAPRCCKTPQGGYPLRWAELMGENMAIAASRYTGHLLRVLQMPSLTDYM